jgi:hypothetical protein
MYKAMLIDDKNFEGDQAVGFFESEELLIEHLKCMRNSAYCYSGVENYAGKRCFVITSKTSPIKYRYYLVKIENGWI